MGLHSGCVSAPRVPDLRTEAHPGLGRPPTASSGRQGVLLVVIRSAEFVARHKQMGPLYHAVSCATHCMLTKRPQSGVSHWSCLLGLVCVFSRISQRHSVQFVARLLTTHQAQDCKGHGCDGVLGGSLKTPGPWPLSCCTCAPGFGRQTRLLQQCASSSEFGIACRWHSRTHLGI